VSSWRHPPTTPLGLTLAGIDVGRRCTVVGVQAPQQTPEWASALDDLGFVAGESVQLMARGLPGGDPLVVRVGCSTYALRAAEAACILVAPRAAPG
jgi:ferrous iron transport protein A